MDWDVLLILDQYCQILYIDRDLASYRWLGSNKTAAGGMARLKEVEEVAARYGGNGLPAYFRLELARLLAAQALDDLKRCRLGSMITHVSSSATTILTSWPAVISLANPHIWRNFRIASKLYRRTGEGAPPCSRRCL
jgi:hypothetical protein